MIDLLPSSKGTKDGTSKSICLFLVAATGGVGRVMTNLANGLADRGHRVDLVLVRMEGSSLPNIQNNIRIVNLNAGRAVASLPKLARYLWRSRPDYIISAQSHANIVAIVARMMALSSARLVVTEHGTLSASVAGLTGMGRVLPLLMRLAYPLTDRVVAVSSGVASDLSAVLGLPKRKLAVVYNPVVVPPPNPDTTDLALTGRPRSQVIISVGHIRPGKDFSTLIRAFAKLRASRECGLFIIGEGPQREALGRLADELGVSADVHLLGHDPDPYRWMRAGRLFVLSSLTEGLPTVLIEAMACGAAIVSTDCPSGPREILEDGKWGQLVPVGAVEAMATAMELALTDASPPDTRLRAAEFGVSRAVDGYMEALSSGPSTARGAA